MIVWVLFISHRHGEDVSLFATEELARKALIAWATDWWDTEVRDKWKGPEEVFGDPPEDDDKMVQAYFDVVEDEWYLLQEKLVAES